MTQNKTDRDRHAPTPRVQATPIPIAATAVPGAAMSHGSVGYFTPMRDPYEAAKVPTEPVTPNYDEHYPQLRLDIDGTVTVVSAPNVAHFPLTFLESHDRVKGIISTDKNLVTIKPTHGPEVRYRVTSYNFDTRRFIAEKL